MFYNEIKSTQRGHSLSVRLAIIFLYDGFLCNAALKINKNEIGQHIEWMTSYSGGLFFVPIYYYLFYLLKKIESVLYSTAVYFRVILAKIWNGNYNLWHGEFWQIY